MSMPTEMKVTCSAEEAAVVVVVVVDDAFVDAMMNLNYDYYGYETMPNFYVSLARHKRRQSSISRVLLPYLLPRGRVISPCVDG